jgi:Ca2+-transporting ATPase
LLGITPASLFLLPLHVVLLELVIDPTCSVVLERQPAEEDIMDRPPRDPKEQMLTRGGLFKSVLQGLMIFAAAFGTYFWTLSGNPANAPTARAMGLAILMIANLLLVQVNSSSRDFITHSIRRLARDKVMWLINLGTLAGLAAILYTPLANVLKLAPLSAYQMLIVLGMAVASTLWYELVKAARKIRKRA